jgi:ribosomal protein S27E
MILEIIMIVIHATQTTLRGSAFKHVRCEGCGDEYVYELHRAITASHSQARAVLQRTLDQATDAVPCPGCGHYQRHMLGKLKSRHANWLFYSGILVLLVPTPAFFMAAIIAGIPPASLELALFSLVIGVSLLLLGVGLLMEKARRSREFDPNSTDLEARKDIGQSRAFLRSELEKLLQERESAPSVRESGLSEKKALLPFGKRAKGHSDS